MGTPDELFLAKRGTPWCNRLVFGRSATEELIRLSRMAYPTAW